jgi:hypothetical protein
LNPAESTGAPTTSPSLPLFTFLNVESDNETHACITTGLNLGQNDSDFLLSLGWGDADMQLSSRTGTNGPFSDLLDISFSGGWFGPVDAYRIERYNAPASPEPTMLSMCFAQDATFVKAILQKVLDGDGSTRFKAAGAWASRNGTASAMSLDVTLPDTAFETLGRTLESVEANPEGVPSFVEFDLQLGRHPGLCDFQRVPRITTQSYSTPERRMRFTNG